MLGKNNLKNLSAIWLVPIVAILIGVFLLYRHFSSIGETIFIYADSADSIVAGKTEIKYHSVTVGKIVKVSLSDDFSKVELKAVMNRQADPLLRADTKLALVKPRINSQGISGLETLLSGVFIEMYPGTAKGRRTRYDLMDEIVTIGSQTKGLYVLLKDYSSTSNSLVGQRITYHGYEVGVVVKSEFSMKHRHMEHLGFVYSPYDSLVTANTKFWYTSALDMSIGPGGINVRVASIDNFINGGISFDIPRDVAPGPQAKSHQLFSLYERESDARSRDLSQYVEYAILLDGSSHTLEAGSKVMHLGIQVGEVIDSNYDNEFLFEDASRIMIPVIVRIYKEMVDPEDHMSFDQFKRKVETAISHGLSASVGSDGLIGGNMLVTLSYPKGEPVMNVNTAFRDYKVIPSFSTAGLASIQKKVGDLLDNLNTLDFKGTSNNLNRMLDELTGAIRELKQLASNLEHMTNDKNRVSVVNSINKTLIQIQKTLDSYSEHSEMYTELTGLLSGIRDTLRSVSPVMQKTNEQPNRYIFGDDGGDERPRAGRKTR